MCRSPTKDDIRNTKTRISIPRKQSAIFKAVQLAVNLNISTQQIFARTPNNPPWNIKSKNIILELAKLTKNNTPVYGQLFLQISNSLKTKHWNLIYTDGSKSEFSASFAIFKSDKSCLNMFNLNENCSIFSAEAIAVWEAIKYCIHSKLKTVICSDSLSTVKAVGNPNCAIPIIRHIRDQLIERPKLLKLMWIPGHANIAGNEVADVAAKFAATAPIINHSYINQFDTKKIIINHFRHRKIEAWSTYTNPDCKPALITAKLERRDIVNYTRLQLGHTSITEQHSICTHCPHNPILSINHILYNCPRFHHTRQTLFRRPDEIGEILCHPTEHNIKLINKLKKKVKLYTAINNTHVKKNFFFRKNKRRILYKNKKKTGNFRLGIIRV